MGVAAGLGARCPPSAPPGYMEMRLQPRSCRSAGSPPAGSKRPLPAPVPRARACPGPGPGPGDGASRPGSRGPRPFFSSMNAPPAPPPGICIMRATGDAIGCWGARSAVTSALAGNACVVAGSWSRQSPRSGGPGRTGRRRHRAPSAKLHAGIALPGAAPRAQDGALPAPRGSWLGAACPPAS